MNKFIFFLLIFSMSAAANAQTGVPESQPMEISLESALEMSLANNREIMAARAQEDAARNAAAAARGMYFPKIDAEGRYTRINDPINIDLTPLRSAIIGASARTAYIASGNNAAAEAATMGAVSAMLPESQFSLAVQDDEFYNFSITAVQPIYAGGRIRAANAARQAELSAARRNTAAAREKIFAEVTEGYFRLKLAEKVAQIRRDAREGIAAHDDNAKKLFEQGMISHANRMRAQVALADAEREEKKAYRDEELAAILLANLMTVEISSFTLSTDFAQPAEPAPVEKYISKALSANVALNIIETNRERLAAAKKASDGKRLPTLAAFGKYELYKQDLTLLEPEWAAGLSLNIPIFSGLSDYKESRQIKAQQQALEKIDENAREQIKTLVRKYHHDMLAAKEEYEALEKTEKLAEENLRLNRLSFKHGTGTSLEVIDAQLALSKVKTDRSRALFDYAKAAAELKRVCGE